MSQVLIDQSTAVRAFAGLLRAHAAATRRLSAELLATHELTISDYEVLLRLAAAPERRLRGVDLAAEVLLTPSGITRLLDGLQEAGYIERAQCAGDRRAVHAVLTPAGLEKLQEASESHVAQIDALFGEHFDEAEQETLGVLLSRLGEPSDLACRPEETG
jgi:DNA-binding MarR family transcriptional regulator